MVVHAAVWAAKNVATITVQLRIARNASALNRNGARERFAEPHDGAVRASARAGFQLSRSTYAPGPGVDGGGIAPWKRGAGSRSGTATAT